MRHATPNFTLQCSQTIRKTLLQRDDLEMMQSRNGSHSGFKFIRWEARKRGLNSPWDALLGRLEPIFESCGKKSARSRFWWFRGAFSGHLLWSAQPCDEQFNEAAGVVAGVVVRADAEVADAAHQF